GFRIELGEVEATLRRHPAVAEAAAQVRSPGQGGELLVAFVTPADAGTGIDAETLRTFLGERLPPAMVPSRFVVLEQLPRTLTGKLDRTALPLPEAPAAAGTSPTSPSELLLASLYGELLGHEDVRREDDFFALGGHSLMAARLVAEVRAAVGVELPLQSVFHSPSVGALARVVDQLRADGGERRAAEPLPEALPRPLPDDAPVSFAQERIWFLERLTPGTATYHLPFAIELDGPLRLGALERSLCRVGERQEALRTAFADLDGRPVQRVRGSLEAPLAIVSLDGLSGGDARREAERLAETTAHRPFALDRAPLWRALLLRLGDDAHRLVINLHHAVADGRSLEIVSRDLATFYRQALEDRDDAPAALPLQPADLAASERERWRRGDHQPALRAAVERLGEPPEPLRLPTDRPRTSGRERLGGELAVRVGAALTARLGDLARSAGATPFMGLLALYQVLLSRWSGQSRLGIGFPVDQRDPVATQEVVGLLVNTAVVFADLGPRPASLRHLETVREAALAAYDERRLPFEQLVEALVPERQLGENPLFQAAFALQPSVLAPVFPGLESRVRALSAGAAKFDLFLFLHPQPDGGLEGTLEYDRSLFDPSTVQRLWRSFRVLLESAVDDPAAPVDRLSLLGSAEAHQLKTEWNDTARATDPGWPLERFLAQARRRPTAPALDDGHRVWSYAALAQTVLRLAHALRQRGIREEDVVALAYPRSAHQVALLLAVVAAGAAYVPLDPAHPTAHLRQLLEDSGARLLLAPPGLVTGELTGPWGRLGFDELLAAGEASSALEPRPPLDGLQAVYTIYTSGSTGRPKGVTISHHSLRNLVDWKVARIDLRPGDRTTLVASVGFDASVYELWPSLAAGACLCVPPAETVLDAPALARWLRDEAITVAFLPTPVAELVLETDDLRGCSLRQVHVGGDRLLRRPPASSDWILLNCYGPAENTVASTLARVAAQAEPGTRQLSAPDIGRPIDNTRAVVVGSGGVPQPVGAIGELVVAGESLGRGYRGRPAETALRFVPDPESPLPGGRRYRTGDRVRLRPDGALDFLGRVDDQVKIRGQRLEPREVEIVLASHPRVSEAVVVARQSPAGLRLLAYCVVRGGELPGEELRAWLGQRLPSAMVPAAVVVLDAFPLTRHGKIDRGALPEPAAPRPTGERSGPIQELLAALWHELLGTLPGPDDEFFDLGGHSLLATRLVSAVRQRFGVELPVRAVFEASTLLAQAELLETAMRQAARGERPPLVRSDRSGELPLSYAQQRLWFLDQLEPESPLYNVPLALRLRGHLSLRGLATAMTTIVRRHEALRSEFAASEGTVVQRVLPAAPQRLPVVDLSALPGDRRQRLAADLARREAARALHLERGELVRTVALRLADDEHWWLLTLHHIATDGWSMGILLEELAVLYQSASEGVDAALPELAVQYGDFAAWQRRWLTGDRLAAEIDHWRRRLAEPP
ncbi:MAG: amino acid adenylation domain-containing protein, partial [Acidobacteria bacterium]|nr:amino acid adenylation domain-containing protein [Acidobacteriota bacterium]